MSYEDSLKALDAKAFALAEQYRQIGKRAFLVREADSSINCTVLGPVDEYTADIMRKAAALCERYKRGDASVYGTPHSS
jgi:hypothetical protein